MLTGGAVTVWIFVVLLPRSATAAETLARFAMPPRGTPSPAELLRITNLFADLPWSSGTGARFTTIVLRVATGACGTTKFSGAFRTRGTVLNPAHVEPGCQAQP